MHSGLIITAATTILYNNYYLKYLRHLGLVAINLFLSGLKIISATTNFHKKQFFSGEIIALFHCYSNLVPSKSLGKEFYMDGCKSDTFSTFSTFMNLEEFNNTVQAKALVLQKALH